MFPKLTTKNNKICYWFLSFKKNTSIGEPSLERPINCQNKLSEID